ncbi:hypothetical protein V6R21_23205 [Limibacter armeniacum]|uniref:hypothetical protein n=1 Tax=Limibacter armeniacum TaxID=466084 RepID=UPI002FE5A854
MSKYFFIPITLLILTFSLTTYSQNYYLEDLYRQSGQNIVIPYDHLPNVALYIDGRQVGNNGFPQMVSQGMHEFGLEMKDEDWTWFGDGKKYRVHSWQVLPVTNHAPLGDSRLNRIGDNRFERIDDFAEALVIKLNLQSLEGAHFKVHYLFRCGVKDVLRYP